MKPVFSPEVAQELGYQKYWPEWQDWAFGTLAVLAALGAFMGIVWLFVHLAGL